MRELEQMAGNKSFEETVRSITNEIMRRVGGIAAFVTEDTSLFLSPGRPLIHRKCPSSPWAAPRSRRTEVNVYPYAYPDAADDRRVAR